MKNKIFIIILAAVFLAPLGRAKAARLATSGFELQSVVAGVENDGAFGDTPAISTAIHRTGAASLQTTADGTGQGTSVTVAAIASGRTYYARDYIYVTAFPTTSAETMLISLGTSSNAGPSISLDSSGKIWLIDSNFGAHIGSSAGTISLNTWYRIEISYAYTTGAVVGRLDGTQFASGTDTASQAINLVVIGVGGSYFSVSGTDIDSVVYHDDVALNDDQGSYQNSWPGDGKIIALMPNATGDANAWSGYDGSSHAGSTTDWGFVDEIPPNDWTDFIWSSTLNQEDLFNATDSGIGSGDTVNVVNVGVRFDALDSDSGSSFKVEVEKASGGTKYQSSAITPDHGGWYTNSESGPATYPVVLYQDPDSSAWTKSTLDSMQIGAKCTNAAASNTEITTLWAMVDYTPTYSPVIIRKSAGGPTIFRNNVIFK